MRIELPQAALHAALQRLSPALSAKPVIPVLGGILICADTDGLSLRAGGPGISIETRLHAAPGSAAVHRAGRMLIPSRCFVPVVRCLPPGDVTLESAPGPALIVRAGNAVYRLSGSEPDDYPDIAEPQQAVTIQLENARLKPLIQRLAFAAATSEARPVLTGIACSIGADRIAFTATDGVRLSAQSLAHTRSLDKPPASRTAVIPAKPCLDFIQLLKDERTTTMILGATSVRLQTPETWLQLPLLEGAYPAVDRSYDREAATKVTMKAADLLRPLERATVLAGERRAVTLAIDGTELTLTARTEGVGDAEERVPVLAASGRPLTVAFNAGYMRDFMRAADGSTVTLAFTDPHRPIVIRMAEEPSSLFVLTPIRIAAGLLQSAR